MIRRAKTVYFIRPIGMKGPIKIGCSKSPDNRVSSLSTWSPFPLEIIARITGDETIERRFHALFQAHHRRREWFEWAPEFDEVVARINAGTFDVSSLPAPKLVCKLVAGKPGAVRTPEQRLQLSYSIRYQKTLIRSGYRMDDCSVMGLIERGDPQEIARFDAFFSDPHAHGVPVDAWWSEEAAATFRAKRAAA